MTWGVGIFDSDLAQSIRRDFDALIKSGSSVFAAAKQILETYKDADSMIVGLAVAALQLEHGQLGPREKKRALTIIISGDGREPWIGGDPDALAARERVLEELRNRLREVPS